MSDKLTAKDPEPRNVTGEADPQAATVAATLRWLASGWLENGDDRTWAGITAAQIESYQGNWTDAACCPCCEEVVCDDDCPLYPVRDAAGIWVGSTGA